MRSFISGVQIPLTGRLNVDGQFTLSSSAAYGDIQNPYASKTANYFLAAPNGSAGVPTFRGIQIADIATGNSPSIYGQVLQYAPVGNGMAWSSATPIYTYGGTITSQATSTVPFSIRAITSQTSDLQQWQSTGGSSVLAGVTVGGALYTTTDIYAGAGALAQTQVTTNPIIVAKDTGATYAQIAMINSSSTGSSDFAAYSDNGTDTAGWVDMGFTGSGFNDTAYTITGKNDGYIFAQSVSGVGLTGNLVLATGGNGTTKDIVFGTGGFLAANEKMRYVDSTNTFTVKGAGGLSVTSGSILPATGTTSIAPVKFTSGTNLTTPTSGVIEYDGKLFYATPESSTLGRVPISTPTFTSGVGTSGITSATNYAMFPAANDTIALWQGTYKYEFYFKATVTTSTVGATLNINLKGAGNAVGTSTFLGTSSITNGGASNNFQVSSTALGTAMTVTASSAVAGRVYVISGTGIIRNTGAGGSTLTPAYQWSSTLTSGTVTLDAGNYMIITPLSADAAALSNGGWA